MKIDFIQMVDIIFKNKDKYKLLTDKDKEDNFYMVNKKFAAGEIQRANFFNSKFMDESLAMDYWFRYFKNNLDIPGWYWAPKNRNKKEKEESITKGERKLLKEYFDINDQDIDFMIKYYIDDLKHEIKKLKRFEE